MSTLAFGTSIPISDFPGIGASMRMSFEASFNAISFDRDVIFAIFTPSPGLSS